MDSWLPSDTFRRGRLRPRPARPRARPDPRARRQPGLVRPRRRAVRAGVRGEPVSPRSAAFPHPPARSRTALASATADWIRKSRAIVHVLTALVMMRLVLLAELLAGRDQERRHGRRLTRWPGRCSSATRASATSPPTSSTPTAAASCARRRSERGTVSVKKPGRMRWIYTAPGEEGVRLGRREDLLLHPAGPAGDRQRRPAGRPGDDAGAVPGRQGRHRPRLHRRPTPRARPRAPSR